MLSNSKLILKSIKNKKVLSLIEKALINGDFKNSPAIAKFLLTSVLDKNYNSDQDLLKIIYNVIGGRPATIEQLTSEEKIIRRKSQVAVLVKDYKINSYLDYGCGNGKITESIVKEIKPKIAYGTDIIDQRREGRCWNFQFSFAKHFVKNSFDLITCFTVLHHTNYVEALKNMRELLTDDGILIIREFDAPSDEDKLFNYTMDEIYYKGFMNNYLVPVEMNYFSKETWVSLFKNLGFEVVNKGALKFKSDEGNPYKPFYVCLKKGKIKW